ncbi:Subtilisin J protein [Marine Group I thaumarchaeote SCGC AAA799-E16]|uniref:Subtilisin J protein n=5 Tax=Marine Group I TaxID=905826 RepID=A0A087S7Z6_9ARCH|nr:Subtilisin J protein [Marine Group I thaumarchaeote SCGC AAA799-N04]KER05506.1 Subtilisin J protein [Marine Group I thaumarchaeote SCGC AAA799-E16]KFM17034.1 Subtilisin J protein [Marine Group I thaumarchaeote SCGC AAA799-D11]KFM19136.1 Subtilisin J protein [Marine Group I thaumarchaeote SCGC RSA3]KFM21850.1 Subtilisin J protein [Marine Group I thaumarchaeote SCGC AAA799-B03]
MKPLFVAIISMTLLFSTFTLTESFAAKPSQSDWVYLIKSNDQGLKNMFGVKNNFDVGFTTFLNERQATALERAGLGIEKVPLYDITKPPGGCDPWPECKNGGGDDDGGDSGGSDAARTATPTTQIPWGINTIYKNSGAVPSGGDGIKVAVLDTGVNKDHFDLKNRIVDCKDFTKGPNVKNRCQDDNGHGTHVAGTILADAGSDGLGIYGVAPGASLMAYKVCASGCWTDDIAKAIDAAGSNGASIVSMSLGGDSESSLIRDAIDRNPHILFIAAAGNDGPVDGSIDYPGANANVVAVGAIDSGISVPNWSSRGINNGDYFILEREVEFGEPGVSVYSAWNDGTYNTISGTSMATPHVSGLAAKVWQGNAQDTRTYLNSLASDIWTVGDDTATGFGLPQVP